MKNIEVIEAVYNEIQNTNMDSDPFVSGTRTLQFIELLVHEKTISLSSELKARVHDEVLGVGPLKTILEDKDISEIIITDYNQIWIDRNGKIESHSDQFVSTQSFENFIFRFCHDRNIPFNFENPFAEFSFGPHRWTFVSQDISRKVFQVCIRRQNFSKWDLDTLSAEGFLTSNESITLRELLASKKSYLVVGPTSSGKTTLLNAIIHQVPNNERVVILEDTEELALPNTLSSSLVARKGIKNQFSEINLQDLLKVSLRLRPDRLVVGEVRGAEAKDLLLALSTGHEGSWATLHADSAAQALLRLEMLVQMGAPQWSLESIRRLIQLSIHGIITVERKNGLRRLKAIHQIQSLESHGFILEPVQELDLELPPHH